MATLELNGKDFATQVSSAEPVIASTVTGGAGLSGSTSLGTVTVGNLSHADIVYPAGHIIQTLHTVKVDVFATGSVEADWTLVTGLSQAITPSATSSKILINISFY